MNVVGWVSWKTALLSLALASLGTGCSLRPVLRGGDGEAIHGVGVTSRELLASGATPTTLEPEAARLDGDPTGGAPATDDSGGGEVQAEETSSERTPPVARSQGVLVAQATGASAPAAAPAPSAPALVTLTVRSKDPDKHYEVSSGSAGKCTLPCALQLQPGPTILTFSGDSTESLWVEVPARGGTVQVVIPSSGRRIAAWVLIGTGVVLAGVGAALTPALGPIPLIIMASVGIVSLITGWILKPGPALMEWVPDGTAVVPASARRESPLAAASGPPLALR